MGVGRLVSHRNSLFSGSMFIYQRVMLNNGESMDNIYIYTFWVNFITIEACSPRTLEIIVSRGNDPQMAELFRLVKYDNLPRYIMVNTGENTVD